MLGGFAFPAPTDQVLLRSVKLKMTQNLSRVPNYTCLETISRGRRGPDRLVIAVPGKEVPFRTLDVLRLEVAELGGVELFARAGEHNFDKKDITEFASGGLIGNGLFSSFAHDVFGTSNPTYRFAGEEQVDGRLLVRYDFTTPQFMSGYKIGTNFGAAEVGYHGSFWTDPQTFDAVRLEIVADAIPTYTGLTKAENRIDFAIVRIGSRDVLLPQSGELKTRMLNGWESRNQISFTHCREYGVESVIKFDDVTDSTESAGGGTKFVEVPPGLPLTLRLETPVDSAAAHVGDVITAIVEVEAKHRGAVIVPKDAVVTGRLRRMEVHTEGWPYVLAGLEFTRIEFEGKQARFFAGLEKIILPPGAEGPKRVVARDLPGVGVVTATGSSLRLPKATQMIWKTISYAQAAEASK
jgi:hypothetical protein